MEDYDITYGDFNPKILYAYKNRADVDGTYHCHDFPEMTYILSGKCKYIIEGNEYDLDAGDLLIANPKVYHQYKLTNPENPAIEFYTGFRGFHFRNMPQDTIVLRENVHIMHCRTELRQEINKLCYEMDAENRENKGGKYFMLKAYLSQMILLVMRENMEKQDESHSGYIFKSNNKSYIVKKIITYLNENYERRVSLDKIAKNMYLSPVYISKLFKEETGESPINYLIKIRLEKARELLVKYEPMSIKEIAMMVGYEDVYYFSKLFKKYYGEAPLYYRNKKNDGGTKVK